MGHWGTSISANDTYMEVYENYFETPYQYKDDWADIAREMEQALILKSSGKLTFKSATVLSWIR